MSVRAKFRCTSIQTHKGLDNQVSVTVNLSPVYAKDCAADCPENAMFGQYTPGGEIRMVIHNPAASAQFEPGKAFYVDFTPAEG